MLSANPVIHEQPDKKLGWEARTKMKQVIGLMFQAEQRPALKIRTEEDDIANYV